MNEDTKTPDVENNSRSRGAFNIGTFLLVFGFIWIVFDNIALAVLFGLIMAGGSEVAQRAASKKSDQD
ncbi:hypothetical protein [Parvularcula sp. IMCC14364]|uniref:hypothetical protein n=1 Tax=Parvularcula sp. IMCC14364 TaxID=3067902 RepID=UPI002742736F|nr:hypothetical protein [Parvularcula sp. IMCC14364]